jgi:hypothetical protein
MCIDGHHGAKCCAHDASSSPSSDSLQVLVRWARQQWSNGGRVKFLRRVGYPPWRRAVAPTRQKRHNIVKSEAKAVPTCGRTMIDAIMFKGIFARLCPRVRT